MKKFNLISLIVGSVATLILTLAIFMNFELVNDTFNFLLIIVLLLAFAGVAVLSFFDKVSKWLIVPMLLVTVIMSVVLNALGNQSAATPTTLAVVLEIGFYVALVFALFKKQKWAAIYVIVFLVISVIPYFELLQSLKGMDLFFLEYTIIALVLLYAAEIVFFINPLVAKKEANKEVKECPCNNEVEEEKEAVETPAE